MLIDISVPDTDPREHHGDIMDRDTTATARYPYVPKSKDSHHSFPKQDDQERQD